MAQDDDIDLNETDALADKDREDLTRSMGDEQDLDDTM